MRSKVVFLILISVFIGSSLFFVFFGKMWTDENWYYAGSVMVAKGFHPFFAFFSHHNPLYFYIYSVPQYLFGPSLLAARLTSLVFSLGIFIFVYLTSKKLGGDFAAILSSACLTLNLFATRHFIYSSYHTLESLFMVLFFFFLVSDIKEKFKYFFCTILLLLTYATRYVVDISLVFIILFFIYMYLVRRTISVSLRLQLAMCIGAFVLLIVPYIAIFDQ